MEGYLVGASEYASRVILISKSAKMKSWAGLF